MKFIKADMLVLLSIGSCLPGLICTKQEMEEDMEFRLFE